MTRWIVLVALIAVSSAEAMNVNDQARAWLKSHQAPQESELDVLKQADPRTYDAVRSLLNKEALGTLDEHHPNAPAPKLSAAAMQQFKLSVATQDRKTVLALEAKMFDEKKKWAKLEESKASVLSRKLTGTLKPKVEAPPPARKKAFLQPAEKQEDDVYVPEKELLLPNRKRLSNLATKSASSWGDIKQLAHATRKTGGKKVAAPVARKPFLGWGQILTNMHKSQQEELTGKNSALAGFSWGEDVTPEAPKPELAAVSKGFVRIPHNVEMPDQLADFIDSGKKAGASAPPVAASSATQDAANPYSMDLS